MRSYIQAGTGAAEAMNRVGQRYADKLLAMTDNAYLQLRNVDILDVTQRVVNILAGRPRVLLTLDHPVILAADKLMPSDLFSIPSGMILGIITSEGSSLSHAAIIARARRIPSIIQVGRDFLDDCDGRIVVLDADEGSCILDPDANTRQQTVSRICARQQVEEDELETPVRTMPCLTRDGAGFELLANCFGPEDIESALSLGAAGVGLLRSDYQILAGNTFDEQEQYYYYAACIAAAKGKPITVRTFDFGSDRTLSNVYKGDQSAHLGMRGIRSSLRNPRRFENQIRALLRAGTIGPLRIVFPMVTNVSDWDEAMRLVQHCRSNLEERGVPYKTDVPFGIMLSIPAACLTAEDFCQARVRVLCHRHQRPDPVHPRRRPGSHQRRAVLPAHQQSHVQADPDGGERRRGQRHPGQHLRPGGGRPGQRGAVPAHGAAQLLDGAPEPAQRQKALLESDALPDREGPPAS